MYPPELNIRFGLIGFAHKRQDASRHSANFKSLSFTHNEIEVNFIEQGVFRYLRGSEEMILRAGDFAVFWGMVPHKVLHAESPTFIHWYHIPLPWFLEWKAPKPLESAILQGDILRSNFPIGSAEWNKVVQWHTEIELDANAYRQIVLLEMQALIRRLSIQTNLVPVRKRAKEPTWDPDSPPVRKMMKFIRENYTKDISLDQLAEEVEMHPDSVGRLFRQHMGVTIVDYINQHRVIHSQHLLTKTDMKISAIANMSGFNSIGQFYAMFKSYCGNLPTEYRELMKQLSLRHKMAQDQPSASLE